MDEAEEGEDGDAAMTAAMLPPAPGVRAASRGGGYAQGLACVLATCVIWVASSFVVQSLVSEGNLPPLVLTYVSNALFVVLILPHGARGLGARCRGGPRRRPPPPPPRLPRDAGREWAVYARAASCVCPLWFLAMYTFNASLGMTNVTANTILSTTSSLFTYLTSVLVLKEELLASKVLCILVSMVGSAMVTLADSFSRPRAPGPPGHGEGNATAAGNLLCLLSALLYALYTNMMKKLLPQGRGGRGAEGSPGAGPDGAEAIGKGADGDGGPDLTRFFGLLGVFNIVIFLPVVLVAQLAGRIDVRAIPPRSLGISVGKGLVDNVLSDYLWARAVLLTSPTVASVGLSIQIPLAMLIEVLVVPGRPSWAESAAALWMTVGGAALVTAGFYGVAIITMRGGPPRRRIAAGDDDGGGGGAALLAHGDARAVE